jgi:hypothetical protein
MLPANDRFAAEQSGLVFYITESPYDQQVQNLKSCRRASRRACRRRGEVRAPNSLLIPGTSPRASSGNVQASVLRIPSKRLAGLDSINGNPSRS